MSKNFNKVKAFYDAKLWSEGMVSNAVARGWITANEFKEITGLGYDKKSEENRNG